MAIEPRLIQARSFAWVTDAATNSRPVYYARGQPVWQDPVSSQRRVLLGWKAWYRVTAVDTSKRLSFRLDLGGDTPGDETANARPLLATRWPLGVAPTGPIGDWFPIGIFAAPSNDQNWPREPNDHATFGAWPGLSAALPVFCEDNVRLLVRSPDDFDWALQFNVTLWIGSD